MTTVTQEETRTLVLACQCAALGDATRLHIIAVLREQDGTLDVDGLVDVLRARYKEIAQPTASYHLRKLYDAGFLTCVTHGLHSYYSVREEAFDALRAAIGGRL